MKRILLLGGTGAIGKSLLKYLQDENHFIVYVTSRKKIDNSGNIVYIQGDAHKENFLKSIFDNVKSIDVIVDFMVWSTDEFLKIYDLILRNCHRYVYLSSSRVYSDCDGYITENSPKLIDTEANKFFYKHDSYAVPKMQQERILNESNYANYTIIRPYITYGESRIPFLDCEKEIWLYRILHNRTLIISEDIIEKYTSMTIGNDCAKAIISIISSQKGEGESITISTSQNMKWKEVLNIFQDVFEERHIIVKSKLIPKSVKAKNCDFQTLYDRCYNRRFNIGKLEDYINSTEFVRMEDGIRQALTSFLENPVFNDALQDWCIQAKMDKYSGEFAKYKEFNNNKQYFTYMIYRITPIASIKSFIKRIVYWFGKRSMFR
ncbi:MAG TPA: epimerase [Eubacterium sp.]|nr:epimerase [Eubacterium sp.]